MKIRKFKQSFRLMTFIAAAAGFVACQENTVDTQGEILPKLATDAQNTYVADPIAAENIVFNISANTPWKIAVDCGEAFADQPWCTVSPALSAVSSLVEEVTIRVKDNPSDKERTATVTIVAEGVDEQQVITIRQVGRGNLTLSELTPSGEISNQGGSATFTVSSNRKWEAEVSYKNPDESWLTLDKKSGTASEEPVTITATARKSDGVRRTATVIIRTELETKTIEIAQEGYVMEFRPSDDTEFNRYGETKTYYVDANVDWKVTSDNKFAEIKKIDAESFSVRLPFSTYFAAHDTRITLGAVTEDTPLQPQSMTLTQPTGFKADPRSGNEKITINDDGSATISASNWGQGYLKTAESGYRFGFGTFTIIFSEINITSGRLHLNNWGGPDGNLQYQLRIGGTNEDGNRLDTGGKVGSILWGVNDWTGIRTKLDKFYTQQEFSQVKEIKLKLVPKASDKTKVCFSVWADGIPVLENVERNNVWSGATPDEIAFLHDGVAGLGVDYFIGVDGSFGGTMTIESFLYEPYNE